MRRIVNLLLIAAILVGGFLAWRSGAERARLRAEYVRLVSLAGDLQVTDSTKLHFLAIETGDPLHFAWRVYFPPRYSPRWTGSFYPLFDRYMHMGSAGAQSVIRVRFCENRAESLEVFETFPNRNQGNALGDASLAKLLRNRWNEIEVKLTGENGVEVIDPKNTVVVLRMTLSKALENEARTKLSWSAKRALSDSPVLYELKLIPGR